MGCKKRIKTKKVKKNYQSIAISLIDKLFTASLCPFSVLNTVALSVYHIFVVQSDDPVIMYSESHENAQSHTHLP